MHKPRMYSGESGERIVLGDLMCRGYNAIQVPRGWPGLDILVASPKVGQSSRYVSVEVKSNRAAFVAWGAKSLAMKSADVLAMVHLRQPNGDSLETGDGSASVVNSAISECATYCPPEVAYLPMSQVRRTCEAGQRARTVNFRLRDDQAAQLGDPTEVLSQVAGEKRCRLLSEGFRDFFCHFGCRVFVSGLLYRQGVVPISTSDLLSETEASFILLRSSGDGGHRGSAPVFVRRYYETLSPSRKDLNEPLSHSDAIVAFVDDKNPLKRHCMVSSQYLKDLRKSMSAGRRVRMADLYDPIRWSDFSPSLARTE